MVFATLWQPCSKVVVDNLATGLQQGCSKLVTLVWEYFVCVTTKLLFISKSKQATSHKLAWEPALLTLSRVGQN